MFVLFVRHRTTISCFRLYFAVRRQRNQIQALQVQQAAQNGELKDGSRLKKNCTQHILCVFCLLTMLSAEILFSCLQGNHQYDSPFELFSICSRTIMLLNSSLNPVIYCWRMRHIRHAIMDIGRNINRSLYCGWSTRKKMRCWSDDMFLIEVL